MPFNTAEIASFLDEALTVTALYTPKGGSAVTIQVIFDDPHADVTPSKGFVQVETAKPTATAQTTDVPNAAHGDSLVINGSTYYIKEPRPDGTGFTEIDLTEDNPG